MKPPNLEPFLVKTLDELCCEARRLNFDLPVSRDTLVLGESVTVGGCTIPNRLCVQPMEGCDAGAGGVPGELTLRRYRRYAEGGFGLIWIEATAVDGLCRSSPRQLWINQKNVKAFADWVRDIKQAGRDRWGHDVVLILQLSHAGRIDSDATLDRLQETYVAAGCLAKEAGFDGVDVKACHGDLVAELLSAYKRPGRYGGSFENRTRFLCETTRKLREALGEPFLLASRLNASNGADPDASESVRVARAVRDAGAQLLNISDGKLSGSRAEDGKSPMEQFARLAEMTQIIQQAVPSIPVVGGGVSWLRHFLPNVAAGIVRQRGAALIGVGRAALAYPSLAGDLLRTGQMEPDKCCITCSACIQLVKDGGTAGCPIRDGAIYGEEYRSRRHFALDHLRDEARRCLACEPAPCRAGCPTRIDVPAFLKAFVDDDIGKAYEIIRKTNVLPEMCSHLCPVGSLCEGPCVTNTLEGNPIPIHDIQYAVCWNARHSGLTGVRVPLADTGKRIAIVGGGPAGIACAVTLLERGHHVVLFERASRLGGTPERLIRSSRFTGAAAEVEAILQPALREARLTLKFGCELGKDLALEELRHEHDAVFLAAGVWGERSLGRPEGVLDGVTFLQKARAGEIEKVPSKVIILAGGDCAMDCAMVARELGARELTIVYAGALSEMHWHMPDSWFRTEGVNFMTQTRPMGYALEVGGKVSGLYVRMNLVVGPDKVPGTEYLMETGMVIEAMGLGLEKSLEEALVGCQFSEEGLVKTRGGASLSCGLSGVYAGGGMINGGAAVVQCIEEGMRAGCEIDDFLTP